MLGSLYPASRSPSPLHGMATLDAHPRNRDGQHANAELYARLLLRSAEGIALFHPNDQCDVLDCGYIRGGSFTRLLNASHPPPGIEPFTCTFPPESQTVPNIGRLEASENHVLKAEVSVAADMDPPSAQVTVTPEVTRSSEGHAFLEFAGTHREIEQLKVPDFRPLYEWLYRNYKPLLTKYRISDMQVITMTVKSAGWRGGVKHHRGSTTAGSTTARVWGVLRAGIAGSKASDIDTGLVLTSGFSAQQGDAARYTIVVQYTQIKLLDKWLHMIGLGPRGPAPIGAPSEGRLSRFFRGKKGKPVSTLQGATAKRTIPRASGMWALIIHN